LPPPPPPSPPTTLYPPPAPQILNNLLGNASKFTHQGFIRISGQRDDDSGRIAISVLDTGIGIPRNKIDTIFLPFEQASWRRPALLAAGCLNGSMR
jgi:signal transduction histidine kinase